MFDRTGRKAIGRLVTGSRSRSKAGRRLRIEPLEGRALMTASIESIAAISAPQFQGYQVPVIAGTTHAQTFAVTSDNTDVQASVAQGNFWSITVAHTSSGAGDVDVNGTMVFQLFQDLTPNTVAQIESLINGTATGLASGVNIGSNFYVGKNFHRIASGFPGATDYIVQGGSLNGDGTGNVFARPFADEFVQQLAFTGNGQLAMANAGSDTNDSQFFITTGSPTSLNYNHTIFGQIVSGQDILQQLTQVLKGTDGQTPVSPVRITADSLSPTNPNGVIHIDTGLAPVNARANITVTATDVTDGTTATQTFPVNVTALASPQRPFLGPIDTTINIGQNQRLQFSLSSVKTPPTDTVTYTVQGGTTTSTSNGTTTTTFTPVANATASVTSNGQVTVTPNAGYTGPITLLVGVRDQVDRSGTGTLETPSNYKTHTITVNVGSSTTPVAVRPLTQQALVNASTVGSTPIQLSGTNPNATTTLPLSFAITTQPTHGVLTGFDPATGRLSYTPAPGYVGPDAIAYTVTDPNPGGLTSFATPIDISVNQASTGAVRFFANDGTNSTTVPGILVVTPLPRTDGGTNVINVTQSAGNIQVTVNGIIDVLQPAATNVDSITVFGSKANDRIFIDPAVTTPVTLNGGTDGRNLLKAGGGPTTEMGWYGNNRLVQGSSNNFQFGQNGHVTFVKGSGTSDIIFSGTPTKFRGNSKVRLLPVNTSGTFFTFRAGKLVKTSDPYAPRNANAASAHQARLAKK